MTTHSKTTARAEWKLKLFIAGQTPRSLAAVVNLRRICSDHLAGRFRIEIIDLVKYPDRAQKDEIIAIPTLIRERPEPASRIIGDLSNTARVLMGIGLYSPNEVR